MNAPAAHVSTPADVTELEDLIRGFESDGESVESTGSGSLAPSGKNDLHKAAKSSSHRRHGHVIATAVESESDPKPRQAKRRAWISDSDEDPSASKASGIRNDRIAIEPGTPKSWRTLVFFVTRVYGIGFLVACIAVCFLVPFRFLPLYTLGDPSSPDPHPPIVFNSTVVSIVVSFGTVPGLAISAVYFISMTERPPAWRWIANTPSERPKRKKLLQGASNSVDVEVLDQSTGAAEAGGLATTPVQDRQSCCWSQARRAGRFPRQAKRFIWILTVATVVFAPFSITARLVLEQFLLSPSGVPLGLFMYFIYLILVLIYLFHYGALTSLLTVPLAMIIPVAMASVTGVGPMIFTWYRQQSLSAQFLTRGAWQMTDILFSVVATSVGRIMLDRGVGTVHESYLFVSKLSLSIFGRLIIAEGESLSVQIALSAGVAVFELASRLTLVAREDFFARSCSCGRRTRQSEQPDSVDGTRGTSVLADPRVREYLGNVVAADMIVEVVGIFLAPITLVLFWGVRFVFDFGFNLDTPPSAANLAVTALLQLGLEFGVDLICSRWETRYLDLTAFRLNTWRLTLMTFTALFVTHTSLLSFLFAPASFVCAESDPCLCGSPLIDQVCARGGWEPPQ